MKAKVGDLVRIKWIDAVHMAPGTWVDKDVPKIDGRCTTVAVLVAVRRRYYVVAQTSDCENLTGVFAIPRATVRKIRKIH
jgi:hypothetical protein